MHISARHRTQRRFAVATLAIGLGAVLAIAPAGTPAAAHVPVLEPADTLSSVPTPIGGPGISRAVYGFLEPGVPHDDYQFVVTESVTRTVGVLVPAWAEHRAFRPKVSIVAEGSSPISAPDPGVTPRAARWEPFSLTRFWVGGRREIEFDSESRYIMRVEAGPGAKSGRYVIVFGGPEQFEATDIPDTAAELPMIWFGTYGGAPFRWNWIAVLLIVGSFSIAIWIGSRVWRAAGHGPPGA